MIEVTLNDPLRLTGALLAAGDWPEQEQKLKPYKPHRVAEAARKYFAPQAAHPAVQQAQALAGQAQALAGQAQAGQGEGLVALFQAAMTWQWPAPLPAEVASFVAAAQPEAFWAETDADWQAALHEMQTVLARADLGQFLTDLFGPLPLRLALAPNLLFPGQRCLALSSGDTLLVYAPPPLAWGTSPPWRYSERPDEVQAMLCQAYAGYWFEAQAPGLKAEALALAAAVLFLRQAEGDAAGDQFMVIQKKTRGWRGLPGVVAALASVLAARRAGTLVAAVTASLDELAGPLGQLIG